MSDRDTKTESFLQAIDRYSGIIAKVCYYYANSREEYDDLRQEAMVCLWQGWEKFRGDAALSTWIYRVCLNACVSSFRSNRKNASNIPLETVSDLAGDDTDRAAMLTEMHALISRLSPREKAVILLWLDNYPYDTIAEMMGVPRNTVASWIKRIKEKLVALSNQ